MKRLIIYLIIALSSTLLQAQENGFIAGIDLDQSGMAFHNMLLVEDTVVLIGSAINAEHNHWGVLFVKMDTLGNVHDYKIHYDSQDDDYIFEPNYDFIKTSDGGYALVGQLFARNWGILMKLDVNGDLEFVQEYPDSTLWNTWHWGIVEFEQGYISVGLKQEQFDALLDGFIMRTDKQGNLVWERRYGTQGMRDIFGRVLKIDENRFLVVSTTANVPTNLNTTWSKGEMLYYDSLGNLVTDIFLGETFGFDVSGPSALQIKPTYDNKWVNIGAYGTIIEAFNELAFKAEIVKRDTDFTVLWRTQFGDTTSWQNGFVEIAQTPDSGYVAVGQYINTYPDIFMGGWFAKVNAQGDSLWSRLDTLILSNGGNAEHFLSGVGVLPSGSIIACGQAIRWYEPSRSYGWVIKLDKDGCIVPGCHPTTGGTSDFESFVNSFAVYPNPVGDILNITGEGNFLVSVYDTQGREMINRRKAHNTLSLTTTSYPHGVYFVKIEKGNKILTKKVIKK
ncbi:MAG: T9SS type A sorting domain-containing protein [Saprospiraceae bacterium]|nr:T9SS type A sorting domain-containing protein [Saprospiraceae bacterium]MBP7679856.1 T9SS type A sorting domain-containing protein [Saprospiraceae bacterium]